MNDTPKVDTQRSDYDLYAALMLSNILDNEQQDNAAETTPTPVEPTNQDLTDDINIDVIWVPADKHPQIAPIEFANFIKTHGANTPTRRSSSLHRKKSILSQSLSSNKYLDDADADDDQLNRTLSEKKKLFLKKVMENSDIENIKPQVFDRNSTALDDSRIIAPKADRSLLRRSAFSARGRSRKVNGTLQDGHEKTEKRRSISQRKSSTNQQEKPRKSNESWDKSQGVSLFDQPVNLSEWIDLGSASLGPDDSQRGILSRVHDAESQLRSQIDSDAESPTNDLPPVTPKPESIKRPSIIRSEVKVSPTTLTKTEKKNSWLGGLFNEKKKKPTNAVITTNSPLSGFASLFTRSLSIKSTNTSSTLKSKPNKVNTNPTTTITTTVYTNINNNNNNNTTKKRSSRLEIPPPSQRTFFNSNRLPLHVERAIYRLSHMKLADPRRPLRQQVLISNLMFWYLSIQQNDFNQCNTNQRIETDSPPVPDTQQKKGGKMSRLIHSAKKRRNEVAQLVSNQHEPTRPPLKQSNVQFSLPPIPSHHPIKTEDLEEEDNVPLSHYKS